MTAWWQTVLFTVYAWNASPVDGMDIVRSSAAMGREFPFPIDLELGPNPTIREEGQGAIEYAESTLPMLKRQRELLRVINEERRARHREIKNAALTQSQFQEGDIVIVRAGKSNQTQRGRSQRKGSFSVRDHIGY